ncbi:MAG: FAD:protein FMN transferase [Gammaproteobacteria bacterium]|nr:FAD:protein FMN transferase [Gammaproteobacteria bacterium]MDH5651560.1 FAD:protein FMN transferase [Gammaproteobacteria bacterium]
MLHKILPLTLLLGWCASQPVCADWYSREQAVMGTAVRVELWHENRTAAEQCMDRVMKNMHRIDLAMSPFKPDSELSKLNREAAIRPFKVSQELFQLMQRANEISVLTHGRFDITFASVGYLYDYRKGLKPDATQLKSLQAAINYRHIVFDAAEQTIAFQHPNVRIDLGGIAKGHAVDQGIAILRQCGIQNALLSAGGDSYILGDRRGRPWMTGIRHPRQKGKFALVIPLSDTAVSTSGDYERYFIKNGVRYHHIISPDSGKPAPLSRSVTILGPDATTTDALSTACFVLGPEKAAQLVETLPDIEAIIIDADGKTRYTSGLQSPP